MTILQRLAFVFALLPCAAPAAAQVSIAYITQQNSSSPSDPQAGPSTATTNGSMVILMMGFDDSGTASTIDSVTCACFDHAASIGDVTWTSPVRRQAVWIAVGNGGTAAPSFNFSGAISNFELKIVEASGANPGGNYASAIRQFVAGTETAATATCDTSAPLAAIAPGSAVILFCLHSANATTFVPEGGWTEIDVEFGNSSPDITIGASYALGTSDTSPTATWGTSGTSRGIAIEIGQASPAGSGGLLLRGIGE